jgi:hypothetical protein
MGIAYVVVGGICVLLGALFTVAHLVRPRYDYLQVPFLNGEELTSCRKLGDHTYLTWDSNQPSTAVTTGRDDRP